MHIWNSWGTKVQLKLSILTFWNKFTQKGYFWSKTEKINTTTEFYIFEFVAVSNFPVKGIPDLKQKNRIFACVHGRYLLYWIFPHGVEKTQRYFNVFSPSSRRNNKLYLYLKCHSSTGVLVSAGANEQPPCFSVSGVSALNALIQQ